MPELWLRKSYPRVIFVNINLPEKHFRVCLTEDELNELPEESTNVFKCNMFDRYMERPNKTFKNGKFSAIDTIGFAEFCAYYYLSSTKDMNLDKNDSQSEILEDQVI